MDLCAYCGRHLPLLHRIVGSGRFCSRRHAELYQKELDELSAEALSRLRPATEAAAPVAREPVSAGPPECVETSRTTEEAVPDPALSNLSIDDHFLDNELVIHPVPADYLTSAPPFQFAAVTCFQAASPPSFTSLLELPLAACRTRVASSVPRWPLSPRRRLFAPAMRPGAVALEFGGPKPALDAQPLAFPSAIGCTGESWQARSLEFLPTLGPEMPRFGRWIQAPLSPPPAHDAATFFCGALPAPAPVRAVTECIATQSEPIVPARRFRLRFSPSIPPLSAYEGSTAASLLPPPARPWSPPIFLDFLLRRASRVGLAGLVASVPAVSIGPVRPEVRTAPLPALPQRGAGRDPLFIPKALVFPVRPACCLGPLPSSRSMPPSRPAGSVVPIRSAASGAQGIRTPARRAFTLLP